MNQKFLVGPRPLPSIPDPSFTSPIPQQPVTDPSIYNQSMLPSLEMPQFPACQSWWGNHFPPCTESGISPAPVSVQSSYSMMSTHTQPSLTDSASSVQADARGGSTLPQIIPQTTRAISVQQPMLTPTAYDQSTAPITAAPAVTPTSGRSSANFSIPSYLRAYISKEPIVPVTIPGDIKNNNAIAGAPVGVSEDVENSANSRAATFNSLSSNLFSQSRELRLLLDRISSFNTTLDSVQRCFERRMVENKPCQDDRISSIFESKVEEKIVAFLSGEGKRLTEVCEQEIMIVVEAAKHQFQEFQEAHIRTIREELGSWKKSVETILAERMMDLKSIVVLQSRMLTMVAEQNQALLLKQNGTLNKGHIKQTPPDFALQDLVTASREPSGDCSTDRDQVARVNEISSTLNEVVPTEESNPECEWPATPRTYNDSSLDAIESIHSDGDSHPENEGSREDGALSISGGLSEPTQKFSPKRRLLMSPTGLSPQEPQLTSLPSHVQEHHSNRNISVSASDQATVELEDMEVLCHPLMTRSKRRKHRLEHAHVHLDLLGARGS